ncbi:MAG: hypothetical protein V4579_08515 [Pseudomonadota bacterium]
MHYDFRDSLTPPADTRRVRTRGSWARLVEQVLKLGENQAQLVRHAERPWASATFTGSRHAVTLAFEGADAVAAGERMAAAIGEHEFDIPGQLVADAAVVDVTHEYLPEPRCQVDLELLLLEDI